MYELIFYENKGRSSEVLEYLDDLYSRKNTDKESRIRAGKKQFKRFFGKE